MKEHLSHPMHHDLQNEFTNIIQERKKILGSSTIAY
jgi:hypothetical protein